MLELGVKVFLSYLAGSLNGALLVGRLYGGVDIRTMGSGNAGGTNALRTQGKLFALLVMLVDVGKGVLPVLWLPELDIPFVGIDPAVARDWLTYACGGAAIFGHCYPVWFDFAGGKGAATTLGVLAAAVPTLVAPAALTWFGVLFLTGFVGLATVASAIAIPVYVLVTAGASEPDLLTFTTLVAIFVTYTHRSNLGKLLRAAHITPDVRFSLLHRLGRR